MKELFGKEVKVYEEEFKELMEIMEKISPKIKWIVECKPTSLRPYLTNVYINVYSDLTLSKTSNNWITIGDLITLEDLRQLVKDPSTTPSTSPEEISVKDLPEGVTTVKAFRTSDGNIWSDPAEAKKHQNVLNIHAFFTDRKGF